MKKFLGKKKFSEKSKKFWEKLKKISRKNPKKNFFE